MSILINMEMPKNCGDCKAFVCYRQWAGDVGDCFCGITKNDAEAKKKNADCPLVPVPPHGRLIDAEAYKSLLRGLGDRNYRREKGTICDAIKFLHPYYAPTIIKAEEDE